MDNFLPILEKLNISPSLVDTFKSATLLRPQRDIKNNVINIKIACKFFAKSEDIISLTKAFEEYLGEKVEITFNVASADLSAEAVMDYLDYYSKRFNTKKSLIPTVTENTVSLDIEDDELFDNIRLFLRGLGINHTIEKKKYVVLKDQGDDFVKSAPMVNQGFKNDRYRSKFTKEEDYLYMRMNKLSPINKKVTVMGRVYNVDEKSGVSKKTQKPFCIETFIVSDYTDAIYVKRFKSDKSPEATMLPVSDGMMVQMYGVCKFDSYDNRNVFELDKIIALDKDPFVLKDDYDGYKHIDLHVHTNRSEYDGVCETAELVKQAYKFGQKAIAITDNSVVQAYPRAQGAYLGIKGKDKETDFKVIYGIDIKMVNDKLNIVYNPNNQLVKNSEFCVLDLETTGLSTKFDHIIEFGGTIVKRNTVTDEKLQLFVKPPVPIPPFIAQKTNITNEMVEDALPIKKAIDQILDFIGDRVIVAHNADFDFNFLNDTLIRLGRKPLKNVCLDTLNLARSVLKNRKYYRLGTIAKNYGVEYDEETAHRGDYDAEVLGYVLVKMLPDIPDYETITYNQLQNEQDADIFKKAHTYSTTILAKNMAGIKEIYEMVSLSHTKYLTYFAKENAKKIDTEVSAEPRILKSEIVKRMKNGNLFVGSSNQYSELFEMALNRSNADMEKCMQFYDYVEIQPLQNYSNLIENGTAVNEERIKNVVLDIIYTADKLGKPIVMSGDVYYTYPYQKIARDIYIMGKRIGGIRHPMYPMNREKRRNFVAPDQHLRTTKELLDEAGKILPGREEEFVINNPKMIADQIETLMPIDPNLHTPTIPGSAEIFEKEIYKNAYQRYGNPLPKIVEDRIAREWNSVKTNGFTVQYYIAMLLVKQSNKDGYPVGSRGSVGSSFIATMSDITEVNPLVPHYLCPKCTHSEFFENNEYANGFDLPPKKCPVCGTDMNRDGHNIPFETFLGFNGDKVPDIDLNFSAEYQGNAMKQISAIFGDEYSYRAGTIGTVAEKTAFGYVKGYCEEMEKPLFSTAYMDVIAKLCTDVKRTTGQHPGGIVVIPKEMEVHDFSPIQYPANNPFADWLTTHYAFADLHDNILKLDILAHVDPTAIRLLSVMSSTGVHYSKVPMSDPAVYSLFNSTEALGITDPKGIYHEENGAAGLPEFGTPNNRRILKKTKPHSFYELIAFEGVTHGTDVWANNAEDLIDNGTCKDLSEVISCRDDIMSYLIAHGMDKLQSFKIMEKVRKGKGLTDEWIADMKAHDVPDWYIKSCQTIKYMFPKAHAVAYAMNAIRVAWYKVHDPAAYYAVYFSVRCDAYDIESMIKGCDAVYAKFSDILSRKEKNEAVSKKEEDLVTCFEICIEMYLRGYHFNNISLEKSDSLLFTVDPDDPKGIVPSFKSIDGLGDAVAKSIVEARNQQPFLSKEDILKRTGVNDTQLAFMERLGVLEGLSDQNQLSLF